MLSHYIENLESTIQWAQYQDDYDVLCLARDRMDQLLDFVQTLPQREQLKAHMTIDRVLPMEWPLWMEACRYQDAEAVASQSVTFH